MAVGLREMEFHVPNSGTSCLWRYLLSEVAGQEGEPAWDLSPDYQRGSVWTKQQRERFLGHVLGGGLTGCVYVQRYEEFDIPCEVVDGKQRIQAIQAFMAGECGAQILHKNKYVTVYYEDFSIIERRSRLLVTQVVFFDLPRAERLEFYLRLNGGGVPHAESELERVRGLLDEERQHVCR